MSRPQIIALSVGLIIAALIAESFFGSTTYTINGVRYDVPHKYEFMRQFNLPWLRHVKGLDSDETDMVMLLLPAQQIAEAVPGYHRTFHGYDSEVPADIVVTVTGGKEAREFSRDRDDMLFQERQRREQDGDWKEALDPETGMTRVGDDMSWTLRPANADLPQNWRPPSCSGSRDEKGNPTYSCTYWIQRNGITLEFELEEGNLRTANLIPGFVLERMARWRER